MPGSCIQGKQEIKEFINNHSDIKTIVDVGAGSATYPKLLGDRYTYIGIEIWQPYVGIFGLDSFYKEVIIADVRHCKFPKGNCIIFGDILEHLPKQDALKVLQKAWGKYKHVVVSVPVSSTSGKIYPGKIHYGNPNEAHLSAWDYEELKKMFEWEKTLTSKDIGIFLK